MPAGWDETYWNPFFVRDVREFIYIENCGLPAFLGLLIFTWICVRRRKPWGYVVSVYIFAAYVWIFLRETIFPFPAELRLNDFPLQALNWVPALIDRTDPEFRLEDMQVWGNFLAGVPFGFGFPFIASPNNTKFRRVVMFGAVWAVLPEVIQLLQMWCFRFIRGRSVDIDDVWLCLTGTLVGYGLLYGIARLYRRMNWSCGASLPIWNHFNEVLLRVVAKPVSVSIASQHAQV